MSNVRIYSTDRGSIVTDEKNVVLYADGDRGVLPDNTLKMRHSQLPAGKRTDEVLDLHGLNLLHK